MEQEKTPYDIQVDKLLQRQKQARQTNNYLESIKILKILVQLSFKMKQFTKFFNIIETLCKKRGQNKKAQIQLVQLCMTKIPQTPQNFKFQFIQVLKRICDKKIFLEVQYARCILMIVKNKENQFQIKDAAKILQEVQVETYGSMDRSEKLQFILYQMKIMIKKQDYVRLYIISKKINQKNLCDQKIDLKILYYVYKIKYFVHESNYEQTARCYKQIWLTLHNNPNAKVISDDKFKQQKIEEFNFSIKYQDVLSNYISFLVLVNYNKKQIQQLEQLKIKHKDIFQKFINLKNIIQAFLQNQLSQTNFERYQLNKIQIFNQPYQKYQKHLQTFRKKIIQHDIRIISNIYSAIQLSRIGILIGITTQQAQNRVCQMMNSKLIKCKIDRLQQTVSKIFFIDFNFQKSQNQFLKSWKNNINNILQLIDNTCNLINRQIQIASK